METRDENLYTRLVMRLRSQLLIFTELSITIQLISISRNCWRNLKV